MNLSPEEREVLTEALSQVRAVRATVAELVDESRKIKQDLDLLRARASA